MPCNACSIHSASGTGVNPFAVLLFVSLTIVPLVNLGLLIYIAIQVKRRDEACSRAT